MIFCSFCGRQHNTTACPPQQYYQVNPLSDHLKVEDLLAIIRSQSNHIITLENLLKEKDTVTKIVTVPIETNTEKVNMLRDFLSFVLGKEVDESSDEELTRTLHEATKVVADLKTTIEFIRAATQKNN